MKVTRELEEMAREAAWGKRGGEGRIRGERERAVHGA